MNYSEVGSYRDLKVWQVGMDLAEEAYLVSRHLPKSELFTLTSQIRRAACSVPANIAEGYGRESTRDYIRFLKISQGSLKELETHLLLAVRVGYLSEPQIMTSFRLSETLGKMLRSMIKKLENLLVKEIPDFNLVEGHN